jgi:hypothetical protein
MQEKNSNKFVRAELNNNGIVVYRLLRGSKRPRAVHTFGYATRHKIWLQIYSDGNSVSYVAEPAAEVKEQIAAWR